MAAVINSSLMDSNVDIDKTLNDTAKKNQLTKPNVKNIIKVYFYLFIFVYYMFLISNSAGDGCVVYFNK